MIKLYGFGTSNYFNMVKQALLYKDIPYEEVHLYPGSSESYLEISPIGKIPAIETEHGPLSETTAILDYLEETYPQKPLYPSDAFARAKVRQAMKMAELYLELPARSLLPGILLGFDNSEEKKAEATVVFDKGITAINALASFSPYVCGETFTMADIYLHKVMDIVNLVTAKPDFNWLLSDKVKGMSEWLSLVESDPICAKVEKDAEIDRPVFFEFIQSYKPA